MDLILEEENPALFRGSMSKNMQFDADADIYMDKKLDAILIACHSMRFWYNCIEMHINISLR